MAEVTVTINLDALSAAMGAGVRVEWEPERHAYGPDDEIAEPALSELAIQFTGEVVAYPKDLHTWEGPMIPSPGVVKLKNPRLVID